MILPFGKYKGQEIEDVPESYLEWLLSQEWIKPELRDAIDFHLGGGSSAKKPPPRPEKQPGPANHIFAQIVKCGYRELVKQHHPDRGGDTQQMAAINAAYEDLKNVLGIS